jgi:uncharacterized protein
MLLALLLAATVSLPHTFEHTLKSAANGVQYKLYVSVPRDYESSKASYPVLYTLDADYSFPIARAMVSHLSERNRLQPLIIVGIAYAGAEQYRLNRTRDYTPVFAPDVGYGPEYQKVSGGGPKFLRFLREELFPWVDRTYRSDGKTRGISGHSYGGLFASWVLVTAPETFSRYIIVSPSLWYRDRMIDRLAAQAIPAGTRVYMGVGSREVSDRGSMPADLKRFDETLPKSLAKKREVFADETHDSVFPTALSRGIRFVFEGD